MYCYILSGLRIFVVLSVVTSCNHICDGWVTHHEKAFFFDLPAGAVEQDVQAYDSETGKFEMKKIVFDYDYSFTGCLMDDKIKYEYLEKNPEELTDSNRIVRVDGRIAMIMEVSNEKSDYSRFCKELYLLIPCDELKNCNSLMVIVRYESDGQYADAMKIIKSVRWSRTQSAPRMKRQSGIHLFGGEGSPIKGAGHDTKTLCDPQ